MTLLISFVEVAQWCSQAKSKALYILCEAASQCTACTLDTCLTHTSASCEASSGRASTTQFFCHARRHLLESGAAQEALLQNGHGWCLVVNWRLMLPYLLALIWPTKTWVRQQTSQLHKAAFWFPPRTVCTRLKHAPFASDVFMKFLECSLVRSCSLETKCSM